MTSDERLAAQVENARHTMTYAIQSNDEYPGPNLAMIESWLAALDASQAEVERLRAREAAWCEIRQMLAQIEGAWVVERIGLLQMREQARALLKQED